MKISIRTPNAEGVCSRSSSVVSSVIFQSTPSAREASYAMSYVAGYVTKFQSTPPVREASLSVGDHILRPDISIHIPAREASHLDRRLVIPYTISIHAPCA